MEKGKTYRTYSDHKENNVTITQFTIQQVNMVGQVESANHELESSLDTIRMQYNRRHKSPISLSSYIV